MKTAYDLETEFWPDFWAISLRLWPQQTREVKAVRNDPRKWMKYLAALLRLWTQKPLFPENRPMLQALDRFPDDVLRAAGLLQEAQGEARKPGQQGSLPMKPGRPE